MKPDPEELARENTELRRRLSALQHEVAAREQGFDELRRNERRLRAKLRDAQRRYEWARKDLERLRSRRSIRWVLRLAELAKPFFRFVRRWTSAGRTPGVPRGSSEAGRTTRATVEQQRDLERSILDRLVPSERTSGPLVSIIILNRSGEEHLRRCLPALEDTGYRTFEVLVVDNASEDGSMAYLREFDPSYPITIIRNETNRTFSEANNQAAAQAEGDLLLLMNNDVVPLGTDWLGRMVDSLEMRGATAVGARLLYPARPGLDSAGDLVHSDLTVQHRGIHFITECGGVPVPRNLGSGESPVDPRAEDVREVPAVTAACMLVRRDEYEAVGGFSEDFIYGTEDVDLCLRLRERGGRILYDGQAVLWHHEYGTQGREARETRRFNRLANRWAFVDRWGPRLRREVLRDAILGQSRWTDDPLHVAITLTRDDPRAGWGDYYTAHELGDALEGLGYRVTYAERHDDRWYELDQSVDVLIVLIDAYELPEAPPGILRVAWVRNWTDRWLDRLWFDDYDIVFASSAGSIARIERSSSKRARLLPLATNPERFGSARGDDRFRCEAVFVGNHWDRPRSVDQALPELATHVDVNVYGQGWDRVPGMDRLASGSAAYDDLPDVYASAQVIVDDTAEHAKPYGALNSRVFDALAAGRPVVTDNEEGVRELFDEEFPTWSNGAELTQEVQGLLDDPGRRERLVLRYRQEVLKNHTYAHRAETIRQALLEWCDATRFGLCIGVPDRGEVERWGDSHFARGLQRQLERDGHPTRIHLLPEWEDEHVATDDVILHLFGLSRYATRSGQLNVLWNISHPGRLTIEDVNRYDVAFIASGGFADELDQRSVIPVHPLRQATDPVRFRPDSGGPRHQLLFVGNSRGVRRRIIDDLAGTAYELAIYGGGWSQDLVDTSRVMGELIPNDELRRYYSSADIVLNDHWDDMREHGFISNRIYDALACGACVVSDHVEGIEEEFDGAVVTYRDVPELHRHLDRLLRDAREREERGRAGREAVLARHTFSHRIKAMLQLLEPELETRRPTIEPSANGPR